MWLGLCLTNILLQLAYRPRVRQFVPALHQLPRFLDAAATMDVLPVEELAPEPERLRERALTLGALRGATRSRMAIGGRSRADRLPRVPRPHHEVLPEASQRFPVLSPVRCVIARNLGVDPRNEYECVQ